MSGHYVDSNYFSKPPPVNYGRSETWNRSSSSHTKTSYPSYQNITQPQPPPLPPLPPGSSKVNRSSPTKGSYGTARDYNSSNNGLNQYHSSNTDNNRYNSARYSSSSTSYSAHNTYSASNRAYNNSTTPTNTFTTPPPSTPVVPLQYPPPTLPTSTAAVEHSTNMPPPPASYTINPMLYGAYTMPQMAMSFGSYQNEYMLSNMYRPAANTYRRKRRSSSDIDPAHKKNKKKKPLSQNIPVRKEWSVEDAKRALEVEREFNKRIKSQSLIIKFPDIEINREIVLKFNSNIESVHFQQPSTPRFCFVTLSQGTSAEEVINELNKTKFGSGYLSAEHKKDREDEINIGPEDIDPLTLYVGNLAQEVTVEDVHKKYPKQKRIDIGFAKKMKYTRYAFVAFHNVDDAIEAFQRTHSSEMYSKSLIVRFRRLHGTVGLPGEPKPQNPPRRTDDRRNDDSNTNLVDMDLEMTRDEVVPKTEPQDERSLTYRRMMQSYMSKMMDDTFKNHEPMVKRESKIEIDDDEEEESDSDEEDEPLPQIFYSSANQRIPSTDTDTSTNTVTNNREETEAPNTVPETVVKKEPQDEYWSESTSENGLPENKPIKLEAVEQNFFQPVVEQIHRPILEPKTEIPAEEQEKPTDEVEVKKESEETEKSDDEDSSDDGGIDFNNILNRVKGRKPNF